MLNAAVLGRPVAHSLSPVLHTAGYRVSGLADWRYTARDVGEEDLRSFVDGLDDSWRGLSLTMPLKEVAFDVATTVSSTAQLTGAVNTLVRREDSGWDAHNTDVHGLVAALGHVDHGGSATLLGSGATARSAAVALARLGVTDVRVAARNATTAAAVVSLLTSLGATGTVVPLDEWAMDQRRLVVSTLPPAAGAAAAAHLDEAGTTSHGVTVVDVVYAGWPTELARTATLYGATVVSGLDMLVHQAAEQFRLFTGRDAPVDAMFAAGRQALDR